VGAGVTVLSVIRRTVLGGEAHQTVDVINIVTVSD